METHTGLAPLASAPLLENDLIVRRRRQKTCASVKSGARSYAAGQVFSGVNAMPQAKKEEPAVVVIEKVEHSPRFYRLGVGDRIVQHGLDLLLIPAVA